MPAKSWTGKYFPDARAHLPIHSAFEMADKFTRNTFPLQQSVASSPIAETLVPSSEEKPRHMRHGLMLLWFKDLMNVTEKLRFINSTFRHSCLVPSSGVI